MGLAESRRCRFVRCFLKEGWCLKLPYNSPVPLYLGRPPPALSAWVVNRKFPLHKAERLSRLKPGVLWEYGHGLLAYGAHLMYRTPLALC